MSLYRSSREWWSDAPGTYARELARIISGQVLQIEGHRITVERIRDFGCGIDRDGLFGFVTVIDTDGLPWTLYSNGTIADPDDRTVGRHGLTSTRLEQKAAV